MEKNNLAPIILFVYNRLDVIDKTVKSLKDNLFSEESELFIFSDGPKPGQEEKVNNVREYIKSIEGFKKIVIFESPKNKGLANSVIDGVTKIVNEYGKVIVLEDDIITSPYFLKFANESLDFYEKDEEVACICGWNYNVKPAEEKTFFIKGADCQAWATWKRAWNLFDADAKKLLLEIKKRKLENEFCFNYSYDFTSMLQQQVEKKIDSWAIMWYASAFLNNKLCLYPSKSLIENIGFSSDATHCKSSDPIYDVEIDNYTRIFPKINIKENKKMREKWANYFNKSINRNEKMNNNFKLIKKIRYGNRRKIVILGFIKFSYKKSQVINDEEIDYCKRFFSNDGMSL